jgi:hypothetical protein
MNLFIIINSKMLENRLETIELLNQIIRVENKLNENLAVEINTVRSKIKNI